MSQSTSSVGVIPSRAAAWTPQPTLPGSAYWDPQVWEAEKERLFFADWFCAGREETVAEPGKYMTVDVVGESVVVARSKTGGLRGFYNVCRHRGTKICDDGTGVAKSGVFKCPYHAWTYDLDGNLVGTPNVHADEGFDKSRYPLWQVAVDTWEGYLFVNLADEPRALSEFIADCPDDPNEFARYGIGELRLGHRFAHEVRANWKVIIENYDECLHCPGIHPELVKIVPLYRQGRVEESENSWGVHLAEGATSFTITGLSTLPRLPGITDEDARCYYGYHLFPNLTMNMVSDCVVGMLLLPRGPEHTTVTFDFLFRPETIAAPGFDPKDIVEFIELVARQDWDVCEREQLGLHSRAYTHGTYPYNDRLVYDFNNDYRRRMDVGRTRVRPA